MNEKCPSCPLRGGPLDCPRWTLPHPRFCELLDPADPGYTPGYGPVLVGLASGRAAAGASAPPRPDDGTTARLARILACPDRGAVLPHTLQPSCGCAELTACGRGRGAVAGRVTLRDCLDCVAEPFPGETALA